MSSFKLRPRFRKVCTGTVEEHTSHFKEFKNLKNVDPVSLHYEYGIGLGKILGDRIPSEKEIIEFYKPDLEHLKELMTGVGLR